MKYKKRKSSSYKRKADIRKKRNKILIVCEGEKTEPNYFQKFPLNEAEIEVKIIGTGYNTDSLVQKANEIKTGAARKKEPYNQVWCVFDKDEFPTQNFNRAIQLAGNYNIKIAYSNEAFELWYLLHFGYYHSAISRKDYIKKLNKHLKPLTYKKNNPEIYCILSSYQIIGIKNAKRLLKSYPHFNPEKNNPSTTVHILVEELNRYKK